MKSIHLPSYSVNLIDYYDVFRMRSDKHIVNDLHKAGLLKENLSLFNKTVKAVLMHHIIQDVCDYVIDVKKPGKTVIIYNSRLPELEITNYINELKFVDFVEKLIKRFGKILPVNIYFSGDLSATDIHSIVSEKDGLAAETIIKLDMHIDKQQSRRLSYTKLSKITKKYGLTFLSKNYFKKVEKKQLIFM